MFCLWVINILVKLCAHCFACSVNQCPYAPQNMHKEPPGTMRTIERLIPRPTLSGTPQHAQVSSFSVNVSLSSNPTQAVSPPARVPSKSNIPLRGRGGRGRPATVSAGTSPMSPKPNAPAASAATSRASAVSNRSSGVQVSRLQPNEATKTALTGELAQRIFEAMLPLMQSKAEPSPPSSSSSPSRTGRGRPPKHKPENDSAANLRKKAESIAMSLLNQDRSNPSPAPKFTKSNVTANKPSTNKPAPTKPANKPLNKSINKTSPKTTGAPASKRKANKPLHDFASDSSSEEEIVVKAVSTSEDDDELSPVSKRRKYSATKFFIAQRVGL